MKIRLGGGEVSYVTCGTGPPLLVLGGLHLDHRYMRPWLDDLASTVELVFHDIRGSPGSPHEGSFDDISHASWVADLDGLREALGHERIFLFGHSYGGCLAQEYALRHPERLSGLILCGTSPALDYTDVSLELAREVGTEAQVEAIVTAFSAPVAEDARLRELWLTALPLYFRSLSPDVAEAFAERVGYGAQAFNHGFFHCLPHFAVADRLGELATPTLIVGGRHDWISPPAQGPERLHRLIPGSDLEIFESSGHFPFIEESSEFCTRVSDWIGRQVAGEHAA